MVTFQGYKQLIGSTSDYLGSTGSYIHAGFDPGSNEAFE